MVTEADRDPTLQTRVDGAVSLIERPLRRIAGSARANILPHAGTISVFLFGVVVFTGIYITLFFEYGFSSSYQAVADLEAHPIQRVMRAMHRYSSAAMVVTTLVHAWRIFVAGRFTASRRFRWVTGIFALVVVWLAGVSGYWLVWDVRAQAIGESINQLVGGTGPGAAVAGTFIGSGAGSGSGLMVFMWFAHLGLTAVIGWALWRHLRRSRLHWLPPRHWMALMGLGLLFVSIALPLGMLAPADSGRLVPDMPLDPFMLFLVPPLLSDHAAAVALGLVVLLCGTAAVPWILRPGRSAVVSIDADACTGCELCVIDCPYLALEMDEQHPIAVIDEAACVGCGICLGSCSFGAIDLPGALSPSATTMDPSGKHVTVACRRHVSQGLSVDEDATVLEVSCAGAFHARAVGDLVARGATGVQLLGCAPNECVYGIGNELAHDRLSGTRSPHVPRRYAGVAAEDFVSVGEATGATEHPGEHPDPDPSSMPDTRRGRVMAALAVIFSVVLIGIATFLPFGGRDTGASVRVVVDHAAGNRLIGQEQAAPAADTGAGAEVSIEVDGELVAEDSVPTWNGTAMGVVDVDVDPGDAVLTVRLEQGDSTAVVFDGPTHFTEGRRFVVEARDEPPPPGVAEGERIFADSQLGSCDVCHSTEPGDGVVGPSLAGVGERAATRVPGMSAEEYLTESILDPNAFIVDGYRADQMLPIYRDRLTDAQIESLVDYLESLEEGG